MKVLQSTKPSNQGLPTDRLLLDEIASKWVILVLGVLCEQPLRFNEIRRRIEGITQKSLTQCLRRLERDGILSRTILDAAPISVEYEITPLGRTLEEPFKALQEWTVQHRDEVEQYRTQYDSKNIERGG